MERPLLFSSPFFFYMQAQSIPFSVTVSFTFFSFHFLISSFPFSRFPLCPFLRLTSSFCMYFFLFILVSLSPFCLHSLLLEQYLNYLLPTASVSALGGKRILHNRILNKGKKFGTCNCYGRSSGMILLRFYMIRNLGKD